MDTSDDYLTLDDAALLEQCEMTFTRAGGPGGQHRNKVSTAVRLKHRATGVVATAADSRSQADNRVMALKRLRMNLALQRRRPTDPTDVVVPPVVAECLFTPRGGQHAGKRRLEIGRKDRRFWAVATFLLDVLDAHAGQLAPAAASIGIGTSNFVKLLQSDRHLLAAAQALRKNHGHGPIH